MRIRKWAGRQTEVPFSSLASVKNLTPVWTRICLKQKAFQASCTTRKEGKSLTQDKDLFCKSSLFFKTGHFRLLESREAKGNGPQNRPSSTNQKFIDWKLVRMYAMHTICVERRRQNDRVCSASCLAHTAFPEYFSHGSFPIPTL